MPKLKELGHVAREKFERYERHISSIGLVGGFILDNLTLRRIDLFFENLVFLIYIGISVLCIAFLSLYEAGKFKGDWARRLNFLFLLLLQFAFGGLFSGFFIFYSRSATLTASWPFLFVLLGLLIGNELLKKRYLLFAFRISIFFVVLFSFFIFYVPIITGEMSSQMFLLSGGISIMICTILVSALSVVLREKIAASIRMLFWSVGLIYVAITTMYFTNILPPIPLSLKASSVLHTLERSGGLYIGTHERQPWYDIFSRYEKIHIAEGALVYVFSSIFAPTSINTTVIHDWQWYDPVDERWESISKIPYPITGGRDGGYRGYSVKEYTKPGRWRVDIKTRRGQLIGREKFEILRPEGEIELELKTY